VRNSSRCFPGWKRGKNRAGIAAENDFQKVGFSFEQFFAAYVSVCEPMHAAATLPELTSVEQARGVVTSLFHQLQQALWRVAQLEKQLYGPSSERRVDERLSKEQVLLSLFPPPAEPAAVQQVLVPVKDSSAEPRVRRQPVAKVLETITQRLEPQEKVCPHCGQAKCEIGCERSERFEYIPAKIIRHELVRPKLACPCGQAGVSIAPLPAQVIEQGQAGASLVAHVILSKYDDHLPLYRQQQQFSRLGVNFARQTLCDWVEQGAQWLQALVREMNRELLAGDYLQVDETPVRVMDPELKGKCATGWLWVKAVPGGDVVFEFHPGRGQEYARQLIGNFQGYLQRDGYSAYGALARSDGALVPVGCWGHARRKFVEAAELENCEAIEIVDEIRKLYLIERHARDECLRAEQRWNLRQELAKPILQALQPRLEAVREKHLPQSPMGKAIRYALNEWVALTRYLEDGRLEIDNNLTENAIRPSAVGKKNWLFIGHPEAGWRSAVIYSVIVSCRRRGIDPWQYLREVLQRLPTMKQSEISSVLPARWKATAVHS
jgi:transposase